MVTLKIETQTALLSQEGSGIAKRIPRGVVPKRHPSGLRPWNHPGASRHPSSLRREFEQSISNCATSKGTPILLPTPEAHYHSAFLNR